MRLRTTRSRDEKKMYFCALSKRAVIVFFFFSVPDLSEPFERGIAREILHVRNIRKFVLTVCPYEIWISVPKNHAACLWCAHHGRVHVSRNLAGS